MLSRDCDGCCKLKECSKRYQKAVKGEKVYCPDGTAHLIDNSSTIEVITAADGYDNFDVGVDNAEQHISANPNNPLQIVFGVNGASGSTWRHTEDGALNWATQNPPGTNSGDPWTAYDSLGNIYIQFLSGTNNPVWRSTNNGATWSGGVPSAPGNDRNTKPNKDFILKKLQNWGIVQRQDSRLWICLSRFES